MSAWRNLRTKMVTVMLAGLALAALGFTRSEGKARQTNANPAAASHAEIDAFNKKYIAAHLRMDNAAVLGMWAEDGISLLPATDPMIGKEAIGKFMEEVTGRTRGYHMQKMDVDFQGIEVSGDWASEWAEEHQVVQPPGRPVIDSYGSCSWCCAAKRMEIGGLRARCGIKG
jgi:ketosteroid isomerase-like protein